MADIQIQASRRDKRYVAALLISSICLLIPAFYNGYPLVNPDVATYLASGFKPETPFDRPITYGLLIRFFSINGFTLWLLLYAQALLVSWLVFRILRRLMNGEDYVLKSFFTVVFLSLFTGLSWIVSQVQPDIFTPVAFLCIVLLVMGKESQVTKILLYVFFFISVAVHLSHPLLLAGAILILLVVRKLYTEKNVALLRPIAVTLILLCAASLLLMGSALSKSRHVYFMGSLLEKGVLQTYLDDNCATHSYRICIYKDELGSSSDHFIWENTSPLYKIGDWKGTKPEFNVIIHDILTTPKYLWQFVKTSIREAVRQMATFHIGDGNIAFPVGSNVERRVNKYFSLEVPMFHNSRQNHFSIKEDFVFPNNVFSIVILLSAMALLYIMLTWRSWNAELRLIVVVCIVGVVLNSIDCAAFSVVNGRYGCKMIWLLPFSVLCAIWGERTTR